MQQTQGLEKQEYTKDNMYVQVCNGNCKQKDQYVRCIDGKDRLELHKPIQQQCSDAW